MSSITIYILFSAALCLLAMLWLAAESNCKQLRGYNQELKLRFLALEKQLGRAVDSARRIASMYGEARPELRAWGILFAHLALAELYLGDERHGKQSGASLKALLTIIAEEAAEFSASLHRAELEGDEEFTAPLKELAQLQAMIWKLQRNYEDTSLPLTAGAEDES